MPWTKPDKSTGPWCPYSWEMSLLSLLRILSLLSLLTSWRKLIDLIRSYGLPVLTSSNDLDTLSPVPGSPCLERRGTQVAQGLAELGAVPPASSASSASPLRPVVHLVSQVAMTGEAQLGNVPGSGRYGTPEGKVWQGKKAWKSTWQHSIWLKKNTTPVFIGITLLEVP